MSAPTLFLGSGGALLRANSGFLDDGEPYEFRARTNPEAPAGPGGQCNFTVVHVFVTFDMPFRLRVTPVVDGIPLWDEGVDIGSDQDLAVPETHRFQIGVSRARYRAGVERGRMYITGTWFQVDLGMPCPPDQVGILEVEGVAFEYQVVSEARS